MNCKVTPIAQNGARTLDALKLIHKVIKSNPSLVVIQFGGNDISRGFSEQIVNNNLSKLISLYPIFSRTSIYFDPETRYPNVRGQQKIAEIIYSTIHE